jgi:hypothetical protein
MKSAMGLTLLSELNGFLRFVSASGELIGGRRWRMNGKNN